jgi:hypothetical protein
MKFEVNLKAETASVKEKTRRRKFFNQERQASEGKQDRVNPGRETDSWLILKVVSLPFLEINEIRHQHISH